jgi:hypothetical protein
MRTAIVDAVLLVAGAIAVATGVLPLSDAVELWDRVWPIPLVVVGIPVVVVLARHARLDPLPFALKTVWIAHTGSDRRAAHGRAVDAGDRRVGVAAAAVPRSRKAECRCALWQSAGSSTRRRDDRPPLPSSDTGKSSGHRAPRRRGSEDPLGHR